MRILQMQKRKIFFSIMALCMSLFIFSQVDREVLAYIQTEGTVTAESANIRKEANASSTAIASVLKGDKLTINNEVKGSDGKIWYYVYVDRSTMGYVLADLIEKKGGNSNNTVVKPEKEEPTTENEQETVVVPNTENAVVDENGVLEVVNVSATVSGSTVNVRKDADGNADKVTQVSKNMVVTITGQKMSKDGKVWYRVFFTANGSEAIGFIRSDLLKPDGEVVLATKEPELPETEGDASEEPEEKKKDYDTVYKENEDGQSIWYLENSLTGESYVVTDLIQTKKDQATFLTETNKKIKSQKTTIIILVLFLLLFIVGILFLLIKCKDTLMDELSPNKGVREKAYRPSGRTQRRPQGERRPQSSTRPQGERRPQSGTRPQGERRPQSGTRPQGERRPQSGTRPQGERRPQGAVRPQSGTRLQNGIRSQSGTKPQNNVREEEKMKIPDERIQRKTQQSLEVQKMQELSRNTEEKWKAKNFMNDDEFEFEFLNWDGSEDKS